MIIFFTVLVLFNLLFLNKHELISKKFNVLDIPDNIRKFHKNTVAITGGLILISNYLLIIFLNFFLDLNLINFVNISPIKLFIVYVFGPISFYLIGLYDDKYNLRPLNKIILSIIIFYLVINVDQTLQLRLIYISSFNKIFAINDYSIFFTIFCFLIFQHAFNMFDGINLQIFFYSLFFLLFLYLITKLNIFLILILPLIVFGYLNFKDKSFMGDGGCYFLSYLFSIHAIHFYNISLVNVEQIYILMILPGVDMLRIFAQRVINGKSPFYPDRKHFHHYLISKINNFKTNLIIIILIVVPIVFSFFYEQFLIMILLFKFIYLIIFYLLTKKK